MFQKVKITYVQGVDTLTCYMTKDQLRSYGIEPDEEYLFISFGSLNLRLRMIVSDNSPEGRSRLQLSSVLQCLIGLPEGITLQIRRLENNKLELGPYIGVFINSMRIADLLHGKDFSEYNEYHATCRRLYGICCFFSTECIDWNSRTLKGLYRKGSSWLWVALPLPRVIYNRNIHYNCLQESLSLINELGEGFELLNKAPKLPKWETLAALSKNPELASLVPETTPYTDCSDVEKILDKYTCAYLKPNLLSKGRGIYRVCKLPDGGYRVEYRTYEVNHVVNLKELDNIDILLSNYSEVGGGYIVQQALEKACFKEEGPSFDLRVLFQKDYRGEWGISGIAGRIAAPGSIITSPRSGGEVEDLSRILEEVCLGDKSAMEKLRSDILTLGRKICLTIEKQFGNCVELGLDLVIDNNLKLWIIEANGKPLRVSLKRLKNTEIILRCNRRPIEYIASLEGFESWDTESWKQDIDVGLGFD